LENETDQEPGRVVDTSCRWNSGYTCEDDGDGDVTDPGRGVTALVEPERDRKEDTSDDGIEMGVIDGASSKLSGWTNKSPKNSQKREKRQDKGTDQTAEAVKKT
jgi:hypothetical protein